MKTPKAYYPRGFNPIHPVHDWAYVRRLARAARRGEKIRPILVDGENLLAGTHRLAANNLMAAIGWDDHLIEVVELEDVLAAPEDYGLSEEAAEALQEAAVDGDYQAIDEIWDR